jgi:hypothetical protein
MIISDILTRCNYSRKDWSRIEKGNPEKLCDNEVNNKKINTVAACALAGSPGNKPVFPQWA